MSEPEIGADFVAMHNLGLPADPGRTLATATSAVDQVEAWLDSPEELNTYWRARGLFRYLTGASSWGKMERKGFQSSEEEGEEPT